jgi:hypothetical protein
MKNYALRFPDDQLHSALKKTAEQNRRSLNNEVLRAIEFYLKNAPEAQYQTKPVETEVKKKIRKTP